MRGFWGGRRSCRVEFNVRRVIEATLWKFSRPYGDDEREHIWDVCFEDVRVAPTNSAQPDLTRRAVLEQVIHNEEMLVVNLMSHKVYSIVNSAFITLSRDHTPRRACLLLGNHESPLAGQATRDLRSNNRRTIAPNTAY